jgi:transposase
MVCLHARETAAALKLQAVKSDTNDANGLAQIVRTGWYRPVAVKSISSHRIRTALAARAKLVSIRTTLYNQIRGLLKTYGVILAPGKGATFEAHSRGRLPSDESTRATFDALVDVWREVTIRKVNLDRLLERQARRDPVCRRLMTVPGVGAITAIAFRATIDDPKRFHRSSDVGAYLGLTPRRYQSGEVDRSGSITKSGDRMLRSYLFEAANVIMHRCPVGAQGAPLRRWALGVGKRTGNRKAKVALARKLAVLLHRLWIDETHFMVETSIPAA